MPVANELQRALRENLAYLWIIATFGIAIGGVDFISTLRSTEPSRITPEQYAAGVDPESEVLEVKGRVLWFLAAYAPFEGTDIWWVPVADENWNDGDAVNVFLEIRMSGKEQPSGVEGIDWHNGMRIRGRTLGRTACEQFTKMDIQPADRLLLMTPERDRREQLFHTGIFFAVGLAVGLIAAVVWYVDHRQKSSEVPRC